ncbi:GHKL domain-containing protein [Fundicoccus sp. Sow4_D5]|uniref:GHKL domain-containing protein n=1 Tax=Fundicoccus sp. Sow4_D5 TaxID=3438782 RepID=UPI003F91033F
MTNIPKSDRNTQGSGLKSIQCIVNKYGNLILIFSEKNWFVLNVLIILSFKTFKIYFYS